MAGRLAGTIDLDSSCLRRRLGEDGSTPLHFAGPVEQAEVGVTVGVMAAGASELIGRKGAIFGACLPRAKANLAPQTVYFGTKLHV